MEDQLSLFDETEVSGFQEIQEEKARLKLVRDIEKSLNKWLSRSTMTKSKKAQAIDVVTRRVESGTTLEDIVYCFTHTSLLKNKKIITDEVLDAALKDMVKDKESGETAYRLFQTWYDNWYKDRYTQTPGVIVKTIKSALLHGVDEDELVDALEIIGQQRQVVSDSSLQYALVISEKRKVNKQNAGANSDLVTDQEVYDFLNDDNRFYNNSEEAW